MKTDRELLTLAAKAAGIRWDSDSEIWIGDVSFDWNPLNDDGDALRLAVNRGIKFKYHAVLGQALAWDLIGTEYQVNVEDFGRDPNVATRRAIVRAAAVIAEGNQIAASPEE